MLPLVLFSQPCDLWSSKVIPTVNLLFVASLQLQLYARVQLLGVFAAVENIERQNKTTGTYFPCSISVLLKNGKQYMHASVCAYTCVCMYIYVYEYT